jgi:hypothetical protein
MLTNRRLPILLALTTLTFAAAAHASTLTLRLTDLDTSASVTVTDDLAGDTSATTGLIVWSGAVGNFTINSSIGSSKPVVGPGALSLTSFNVSNGALGTEHLLIELSDINFSVPSGNLLLGETLTNNTLLAPGGSLVGNGYQSNANTLFNYGDLATGPATIASGVVGTGVSTSATGNFVPLYSLSEKIALTIAGAGSANWTADLRSFESLPPAAVPEPASLLLLSGGLLALWHKRKRNVSS